MKALAAISGYLGIFMFLVALVFRASQFPDPDELYWNTIIWISFVVLGCVLLITWAALNWEKILASLMSRSTLFGVNMVFIIAFVIGIVVLVNLVAEQHPMRGDYTKSGRNTLSQSTKDFLQTLTNDIELKYFFVEGGLDPRSVSERLLNNFAYTSSHIKFSFVNADKNPEEAQAFEVTDLPTIVILNGDRRESVKPSRPDFPYDEETLVNGIVKVTRQTNAVLYYTQGHGEFDVNQAVNLKTSIERDGYRLESLVLSQYQDIPDASGVVVSLLPTRDFFPQEIDTLKRFLDQGGRYLVAVKPDFTNSGNNRNLLNLLSGYGVDATNCVMIDPPAGMFQMLGLGANTPILFNIDKFNPVTKKFGESGGQVQVENGLAFKRSETPPTGVTVTELVSSSSRGWGETSLPLQQGGVELDDSDLQGPVALAVAVSKMPDAAEQPEGREMRIVALGDLQAFLSQQTSSIFFNAINWLGDQGDLITVERKPPNFNPLTLSKGGIFFVFGAALFGIPIIALGIGIIVWSLRRTATS